MFQHGLAHFDFASMLINWCTSWAGEHKARIIEQRQWQRTEAATQQQWRQHHIPLNRSKFIICIYEENWLQLNEDDVSRCYCKYFRAAGMCSIEKRFSDADWRLNSVYGIGIVCVFCEYEWMDGCCRFLWHVNHNCEN